MLTEKEIMKILDNNRDKIVKKAINFSKELFEKFKIDMGIAFSKYTKNSYEKYSKIKTLLYRTEPKYIYDFFEIPYLSKKRNELIRAESVNDIINISHFIIIQGQGGIGKSTLLKHLFINELSQKDLIPIFIELKDINQLDATYELSDLTFNKLSNLGTKFDKEYIEYALKSGSFLFLLDGYDEIISDKKDFFFKIFDAFCDKYSDNYFIISSRPYSEFIEFQRFTILSTCELDKNQAVSLISKIDFDEKVKENFINELESKLYEQHKSFASNPLLLNIMLLTYDNYAEIPEKLHMFYGNAFDTLYSKHDATKAGYKREFKCNLSLDDFKKIFSYFCFITYFQGKYEFTYDELVSIFKKTPIINMDCSIPNYIYDLINSLCVINKDGLNYKFTHRSFQEYFTALFLKEQSDENMNKMGINLIHKDIFRSSNDNVFWMLYDMAEDRFEQNILLPLLHENEFECEENDYYDFYFRKYVNKISLNIIDDDDDVSLILQTKAVSHISEFIFNATSVYLRKQKIHFSSNDDLIYDYLTNNLNYELSDTVDYDTIISDPILRNLINESWIGKKIVQISKLSQKLEEKKQNIDIDLTDMLME